MSSLVLPTVAQSFAKLLRQSLARMRSQITETKEAPAPLPIKPAQQKINWWDRLSQPKHQTQKSPAKQVNLSKAKVKNRVQIDPSQVIYSGVGTGQASVLTQQVPFSSGLQRLFPQVSHSSLSIKRKQNSQSLDSSTIRVSPVRGVLRSKSKVEDKVAPNRTPIQLPHTREIRPYRTPIQLSHTREIRPF